MLKEDLRKWFSKTHPEGNWVRMSTTGKILGPCARQPGEGKPKCLPLSKARSMDKEDRAAAVKRKRREDPDHDRKGAPINVKTEANWIKSIVSEADRIPRKPGQPAKSKQHSDLYTDEDPKGTIHGLKFATVEDAKASVNKIKSSDRTHAHKIQAAVAMEQRARVMGKSSAAAVYRSFINGMKEKTESFIQFTSSLEESNVLLEKNKPTNPGLWSRAKTLAKSKFDVYPSAYANGWAAKWYKSKGGSWKSVSEETKVEEENEGKKLNKPFLTPGGPKKRSVFVKNEKGNTIKVSFGDPNLSIKRDNPERKKSFRARHNCDDPGPKTKARYWSCRYWSSTPASKLD